MNRHMARMTAAAWVIVSAAAFVAADEPSARESTADSFRSVNRQRPMRLGVHEHSLSRRRATQPAAHRWVTQAVPEYPNFLEPEQNIVFLGDSITQAGTYIAYIEAYLWNRYPDSDFRLINLGLGSETASCLSEPDHPFPRPCIHSRLDRVIEEAKPEITFVCYGMNDGIYHPLSPKRLEAYREGMIKLIDKLRAAGSRIVLLTPPPFDAETRRLRGEELAGPHADEYGYRQPYADYDKVLEAFGDWVLEPKEDVELAIDVHTPLEEHITARRAVNPDYEYGDGVHPSAVGHHVLARAILRALEAPGLEEAPDYSALSEDDPRAAAMPLILRRHRLLSAAWREHVGHGKPGNSNALPLAEAQAQADKMEAEIDRLLTPLVH